MTSGVATNSNNNQGTPQQQIQLQEDGLIPLSTGIDTSRLSQGTSSAAPSPILSPQGKTFGRNINGTSKLLILVFPFVGKLEKKNNFPPQIVFFMLTELTIIIRHLSIKGNGVLLLSSRRSYPNIFFIHFFLFIYFLFDKRCSLFLFVRKFR